MHLEILLQEQLISRKRLAAFAPGKVPLDPGVTRCVEVRVNGQLMAVGELVQLEDRLGVELQETFQEWLPR